jgi:aquaporin Z
MATPAPSTTLSDHDQARALRLLTLEFGRREDFDDPRLAYRRLFSEVLGTFLLLLAAAGGGILHAKGQISLAAAVVAPGLTVMAVILFMGAVSGAHLNPAVSIAFALRRDFPARRLLGYVVAQRSASAGTSRSRASGQRRSAARR